MYTGQVAVVSNRETWVSDFYQIEDEDTGEIVNISNPEIGFDCSLYIKTLDGCSIGEFPLSGGKVVIAEADDGPGFQWVLDMQNDVSRLCAGTYICGVKTTANGVKSDIVIGTIAVIEGN